MQLGIQVDPLLTKDNVLVFSRLLGLAEVARLKQHAPPIVSLVDVVVTQQLPLEALQ
jgi:hypothetical protein